MALRAASVDTLGSGTLGHKGSTPSDLAQTKKSRKNVLEAQTDKYDEIIEEARENFGYGSMEGAFPEEWGAQLLLNCSPTADGAQVVICVPAFLKTICDDEAQLDRAFRFMLIMMDSVAMRAKGEYIFIVCYLGVFVPWPPPEIAQRITLASQILPRRYLKNLRHFYILHTTSSFRLCMAAMQSWIFPKTYEKMQYVGSLDELCQLVHPGNKEEDRERRVELLRKFPFLVHRRDAEDLGTTPPAMFGMPLKKTCKLYGVSHVDRTTGKKYPRLPFPVVFLCERMEREEAEVDFGRLYSAPAADTYNLVDAIDTGSPLESDIPGEAMWGILKLYLDCLPYPLLTFKAYDAFKEQGISFDDAEAQLQLLIDLLNGTMSEENADVVLYLASFFYTMCNSPNLHKFSERAQEDDTGLRAGRRPSAASLGSTASKQAAEKLTPEILARVMAPAFLRAKEEDRVDGSVARIATSLLQVLIESAQDERLWPARHQEEVAETLYSDAEAAPSANVAGEDSDAGGSSPTRNRR